MKTREDLSIGWSNQIFAKVSSFESRHRGLRETLLCSRLMGNFFAGFVPNCYRFDENSKIFFDQISNLWRFESRHRVQKGCGFWRNFRLSFFAGFVQTFCGGEISIILDSMKPLDQISLSGIEFSLSLSLSSIWNQISVFFWWKARARLKAGIEFANDTLLQVAVLAYGNFFFAGIRSKCGEISHHFGWKTMKIFRLADQISNLCKSELVWKPGIEFAKDTLLWLCVLAYGNFFLGSGVQKMWWNFLSFWMKTREDLSIGWSNQIFAKVSSSFESRHRVTGFAGFRSKKCGIHRLRFGGSQKEPVW